VFDQLAGIFKFVLVGSVSYQQCCQSNMLFD
jgi:hypothetical protein